MNEDRHRKAVAQVMVYEPPPVDTTQAAERLELDVEVAALHRQRGWRRELRKVVEGDGRKVLAINVLGTPDTGPHPHEVVITVQEKTTRPRRMKPVTRGGRPIEGPIPVRTMATKRRAR